MNWKKLTVRAASIAYGMLNLGIFVLLATLDGSTFRKPSDKAKKELAAATHRLWGLTAQPNGIKHHFHTLSDGTKLHYVTAEPAKTARNLIIFLHGFPDSWAMWKYHLSSTKLSSDSTLVALDLPGYGGSDDLPEYDATNMLEAVTQFILDMKATYIHAKADSPMEKGRVILVCHDWGAVIGFRLASEAPQVADRFILASAVHPALAIANIKTRWTTVVQMLRTWKHRPRSVKLLKKAAASLSPLLRQLKKSGYIFVFNLPAPIANAFGPLGNYWFMRLTHELAAEGKKYLLESREAAEMMAGSLGPSIEECSSPMTKVMAYPPAVKQRAPTGGWSSKIRIYRDGLLTKSWTKSMDTLWSLTQEEQSESLAKRRRSSAGAALFDSGPEGSLKAKVTVLWGSKDPAGEARVALEGIEDYMSRDSQVLVLDGTGHWMPVEKNGKLVIEEIVKWAADGERTKLRELIKQEDMQSVKLMAER
ncbi:alpha/beta-hydrolase [Rhizodiscina lignyota]|uniref:Alpha/beta-hydrolase n=1 Tax=Rhizodiscina lignyota TaxID=1504668 RepID=A0A9P4M976_9PEZI|nr:alpha/beta-hydrolase [Rhizodiscina lignyota]